MNQTPAITASPKTGGAVDVPEVFAVLRRYAWIVIAGAIGGSLLALVLSVMLDRYDPKYTASVTFQVLPPSPGVADKLASTTSELQPSQEEISQFINRQALYIKSDAVLNQALQSDAFQHDPVTNRPSQWVQDHPKNTKRELRNALHVDPKVIAGVFTISMTTGDNVEVANLVNAVARVYTDQLSADNKENQSQRNQQLNDIVVTQKKTVQSMESTLADFRANNNISAVVNLHSLELRLLEDMDTNLIKVQAEAASAKETLDNITAQLKSGTLELSSDMKQYVENQPEMLNLMQTNLALEQDKQVALLNLGSATFNTQAIDKRIETVNNQIATTRARLESDARLRMEERAKTDYQNLLATAQFMDKAREDKLKKVQDLDHFLVQEQELADALKSQKDILDTLTEKYTLSQLQNTTDDTRIRKLGGDAIPPEKSEIAWPEWYYFMMGGFVIGLLGTYGLAYLYELTNTRVRTPADITKAIQLPLLGFVPDEEDDSSMTGALATSIRTAPASMMAESFRQIRGRLISEANGSPTTSLLIASIAPGGGATTVASNLANGMALNKMRVLLVDANFYRPGLQTTYKNIPAVGLTDVIADATRLDSSIVFNPELPNLHLMGAGGRPSAANVEVFESAAFKTLLTTLKSRYDMVIFDGAPLNLVADSIALGSLVDGVIAVVRAGEVSRGTVLRVREQLRQARARLLGVVLNAAQTHGAGYFKQNYKSFYEYAGSAPKSLS
jgi:succinoglycan biosynthesis transport protein ExoP